MSTTLAALSADISALAASAAAATVTVGRNGRGSGIVIGTDEVLTSAHNLRDRTTQVTLPDGTEAQAEVVATDPHGDLAVLKVPTGAIEPLALGTPGGIGSIVVAVGGGRGNPRVALALVGSVQRRFRGPGGHPDNGAFEHDAALPKGASGGPVVDAEGRLVGIDTHRTATGYLARPFDEAMLGRLESLRAGQDHLPRRLGVVLAPPHVADELRAAVGLEPAAGALVRAVDPEGAAAAAGVRQGDLITSVRSGEEVVEVDGPDSLQAALDRFGPADALSLSVLRGVDTVDATVTFAAD
ncbi:MAG: trypsin-like peptidase domain-containing protein [Acidimicrobiales bacterium]